MQSGIFLLRYRTEMTGAGMPMPALVLLMPMPNYATGAVLVLVLLSFLYKESDYYWSAFSCWSN
jgi:hypothetical protein